jgi:hypothetical protein
MKKVLKPCVTCGEETTFTVSWEDWHGEFGPKFHNHPMCNTCWSSFDTDQKVFDAINNKSK